MKKQIIILITCIIFPIIMVSCATNRDIEQKKEDDAYEVYTAYIDTSGMEGSDEKIEASKRLSLLRETDIPEPSKTTISIDIFGVGHRAEYSSKKVWSVYNPSYVYKTTEGDEITVDSSGNILSFIASESFSNYVDYVDQDKAITPEEALKKGTEYLVKIVGKDIASNYSAELPDTSMTVVRVRFLKKDTNFGRYSINDKIIIKLDENGNLLGYDLYNVGAYENKKIPDDFNDEKMKEIINKSLIDNKSEIELSDQRNLVILADGKMACYTSFRIIDGETVGEWTSVLIPLE